MKCIGLLGEDGVQHVGSGVDIRDRLFPEDRRELCDPLAVRLAAGNRRLPALERDTFLDRTFVLVELNILPGERDRIFLAKPFVDCELHLSVLQVGGARWGPSLGSFWPIVPPDGCQNLR